LDLLEKKLKGRKRKKMITEVMPMYLCNGSRACNTSKGFCGEEDGCRHTVCEMFAKNEASVELFKAFTEAFSFEIDACGRIICKEK
jgi:hypothetical protein